MMANPNIGSKRDIMSAPAICCGFQTALDSREAGVLSDQCLPIRRTSAAGVTLGMGRLGDLQRRSADSHLLCMKRKRTDCNL